MAKSYIIEQKKLLCCLNRFYVDQLAFLREYEVRPETRSQKNVDQLFNDTANSHEQLRRLQPLVFSGLLMLKLISLQN